MYSPWAINCLLNSQDEKQGGFNRNLLNSEEQENKFLEGFSKGFFTEQNFLYNIFEYLFDKLNS